MKVSINFLVRIAGMVLLAFLGANIGISLSTTRPDASQLLATYLLMLAGASLGLLVTPRLTIEPIKSLLRHMRGMPLDEILFIACGGFIGLLMALLLTIPLSLLPDPVGKYAPLIVAVIFAYIGTMTFISHKQSLHQFYEFIRSWRRSSTITIASASNQDASQPPQRRYLLDTSAIIDGRIAAVSKTGFLEGKLLAPLFVVTELQGLADSSDDLKRSKGRRGLEILSQMQKDSILPVEIIEADINTAARVDDKLVVLARQYQCPIITNDFNLNRVAGLQGVTVLSLNQLSEAVRPPVMQDQRLQVLIRNEGNARQQGVGYLEDGTPVIVEEARHLIGQQVDVTVLRLHQTQTGRLVFAQISNGATEHTDQDGG